MILVASAVDREVHFLESGVLSAQPFYGILPRAIESTVAFIELANLCFFESTLHYKVRVRRASRYNSF